MKKVMNYNPVIMQETSKGLQFFHIEDEMLLRREIFLVTEVNAETCSLLIKQLLYLDRNAPGEPITLYISSPGGEVVSGLAVYDLIQTLSSPVHTVCIGTAASMGAILFLAGKKRKMYAHTKIMIHDPSFSKADFSFQKPLEIQSEINSLMQTRDVLADIIVDVTGQQRSAVLEKTAVDSFFSAKEAVEFGLATEIIQKGCDR